MSDKHVRSIRLNPDVHDRLISLCDHLGVTPNSYIVQAIGKAISSDEVAFHSKENSNQFYALMASMIGDASDQMKDVMEQTKQISKDGEA